MLTILLCLLAGLLLAVICFFLGAFIGSRSGSVPFISRPEQWAIGLYAGPSPLEVVPGAISNPILTAADVTDREADFVADPFMIEAEGTWYLFFEVVDTQTKRGEIALATSDDGHQWTYRQVVLSEGFHLSYPYVFTWQGDYYMIPESSAIHAVRLYKAMPFPTVWRPVSTLLYGPYNDPSLFRHDGRWWLFTSIGHGTLHLFYAETLEGPWTKHPRSPVIEGNAHIARPGGRVLVQEDRILRFAQDCYPTYGNQLHAFAITELTPTRYAEQKIGAHAVLTPDSSGSGWNGQGMHHLDAHQASAREWIACVDGYAGRRLVVGWDVR